MIPMADNLNHSHMTIINETINKSMQKACDPKSKYFTRDKFMNDYSAIFNEEELKKHGLNLTGRFNRQKFEENVKLYSLDTWKD